MAAAQLTEQTTTEPQTRQKRRHVCARCSRPGRACLCSALAPGTPLRISGAVIVLQHPFEPARKLGTARLLPLVLERALLLRGRHAAKQPTIRALLAAAASGQMPVFVLFPSRDAVDVCAAAAGLSAGRAAAAAAGQEHKHGDDETAAAIAEEPAAAAKEEEAAAEEAQQPLPDWLQAGSIMQRPAFALLAFDGTWTECSEMARSAAQAGLLSAPGVACVRLPLAAGGGDGGGGVGCDAGAAPSPLPSESEAASAAAESRGGPAFKLRTEPFAGGMSTHEAVCRAVAAFETALTTHLQRQQQQQQQQQSQQQQSQQLSAQEESQQQPPLLDLLLAPLARMVEIQATFDPAVRQRMGGRGYVTKGTRARLGGAAAAGNGPGGGGRGGIGAAAAGLDTG